MNSSNYLDNGPKWSILNGAARWSFTSLWVGPIPQMELLKIFSLGQGPQGRLGPPPTIRFLNKFQMIFVLDNKTQMYYVFKNNKFNIQYKYVYSKSYKNKFNFFSSLSNNLQGLGNRPKILV